MTPVAPTTDRPASAPPPKLIARFVKGERLRATGQLVLTFAWVVVSVRIFVFFWAAVYFLLTQNHWVKHYWDLTWEVLRHFLRDYGEYMLATTVGWFVATNRWSRRSNKPFTSIEHFFDRIGLPSRAQQERTHPWQFWWSLPMTLAASVPGAALVFGVYLLSLWIGAKYGNSIQHAITGYGVGVPLPKPIQPMLASQLHSLQAEWPIKLAGILGGIWFGRLVFTKVAIDAQKYLVERRAAKYLRLQAGTRLARLWAKWWVTPRWPLPVAYRAEYMLTLKKFQTMQDNGKDLPTHPLWVTLLQRGAIPLVLLGAWRGWWVLHYIAHK
jgi:hypothetical protein